VATNESDFKAGFKKDLIAAYPTALVWTNSDMFRVGLPDMSALWDSKFFAMELKFVRKLPKRGSSKCLTHEVSAAQLEFLRRTRENRQRSAVIVGMRDVAVFIQNLKENYTLDEILGSPRILRENGAWSVKGFLDFSW
jgi:hypothetical protein